MGQYGKHLEAGMVTHDDWGHIRCCPQGISLGRNSGAIKKKIFDIWVKHEYTLHRYINLKPPTSSP